MLAVVTTKSLKNLHLINWPTPKVLAFSTTRFPPEYKTLVKKIGVAKEITAEIDKPQSDFNYFNLGDHVGDCPLSVENNRKTLLAQLPSETKIQWLEQVHGNTVIELDAHSPTSIVADAIITRKKNIALAIMTADCLPILLADKNGNEIAAIHAGWRPLAANIIEITLAKMRTKRNSVTAWLGPCIGQSSFEVGSEVKKIFTDISSELSYYFIKNKHGKYQADLAGIAIYLLRKSGVSSIKHQNECTFTKKNMYYSYRRQAKTGRMASIVYFNK